jgi:sugar O-acyltransferase (sialic acid O-acetyltransferase NeuD family)
MKIAVIGNGDLAKQLLGFVNSSLQYDEVYFDDFHKINNQTHFPFLNWKNELFNDYSFLVGLGYKNLIVKNKLLSELNNLNRELISFCHSSSFINKSAIIGQSVFVYPMCNIDLNVTLNDGVILNNSVVVSHDTIIGKCTYISPGVTISGRVTIGENCFIGSGTIIANDIVIGDNVIIGIGSVITSNIPNNSSVIGNPFKFLKKSLVLK